MNIRFFPNNLIFIKLLVRFIRYCVGLHKLNFAAMLCHALCDTQSDYYLPPSQAEIITSVNDGEVGRAQQLYFPAQPRRTPAITSC